MPDSAISLGVSRRKQAVGIAIIGALLVLYGLLSTSAIDASYDPLPFGVGVVMVVYAGGVLAHDALFRD